MANKSFVVRRIIREDVVIFAENIDSAITIAIATQDELTWDCYDCEYWGEDND